MEALKINSNPCEKIVVNNISVEYGSIPSGLIEGHSGIVFYFKTTDAFDKESHEAAIKPLLKQIQSDNDDHGVYWDLRRCEALVWKERSQVTVASFRVRDSY